MANANEDVRAIDVATDLLVRGLNRSDISSITDLVTDTTLVLAPARRTAKGRAVLDFWRNLALANEGVRMLSTEMDTLADGLVRDLGTLSLRSRQSGEQTMFRYMLLWKKSGETWTVATMTWNREPPAGGGRRAGGGQGDADGGM